MAKQQPKFKFSQLEKELLSLISILLKESIKSDGHKRNTAPDQIPLSNKETKKFVILLELLLNDKNFREKSEFIAAISTFNKTNTKHTRMLFNAGIRKARKTEIMVHHRWYEFVARIGLGQYTYINRPITPMTMEQFLKLEHALFKTAGIKEEVLEILMSYAQKSEGVLIQLRKQTLPEIRIWDGISQLIKKASSTQILSRIELSSIAFVVANGAALFHTRDWTTVGGISCMIGQAANILKKKS